MKLVSTRSDKRTYSLHQAVTLGLAPDGGLFMPNTCHPLSQTLFQDIHNFTQQELLTKVTSHLLGDVLSFEEVSSLINDSITFPSPVIQLSQHMYVQELFHGPSLAFKDFGASFMSNLLLKLRGDDPTKLLVIVATSGDTGGAVAAGFSGIPGIEVAILFPKGGVSRLQEKQLTTFGDNVHAVEVDGTFDHCQSLVKACFQDDDLRKQLSITSANSINIGRLLPQLFYYFDALRQLDSNSPIVFSVPSGNFGNLTAGLMSTCLGLPIHKFLAATNVNDVIPKFLETGIFNPRPSVSTISNAMDVGDPSNYQRMKYMFESSTWNVDQSQLLGYSFTDHQTREQIKQAFERYSYTCDPHGAIALRAALQYQRRFPNHLVVALQTAHPSKFVSTVEGAIGSKIDIHPTLVELQDKPCKKTPLGNNYSRLKEHLLSL